MHVTTGSFVGPYRVLSALGAGGMGEVYRARDEKLNRDVALKVLSADMASSSEHLRRFEQEARAASALNHPNIIAIYDIGRADDGIAYIAMELVDGEDVRNLAAGTPLPLKQALRVAVKVADGLAAAHERGIVHRDLKPENVMVSRDGFVKILDFGLAKLAVPITDSESTVPHTTPGAVFGTVGYMSPEQASGRPADFRSDQFALGVMLYEMITGRLPFSEPTAAETLAAIIRKDPAPIQNASAPPELLRIINRCLAKEPVERYASTRDLARDLREVRDRISQPSSGRQRTGPVFEPNRRAMWVGLTALTVVLAAVAVLGILANRRSGQLPQGDRSVAIVPFRDLSQTAEGRIFADGLADMIGTRLLQSRKIRVMPPSGSDGAEDPRKVAQQKGASFALTGSVLRSGNAVHLSYALIDSGTGEQVAGDTLKGPASDVFEIENRAVTLILAAMRVRIDEGKRTAGADITSPADQNAYLEVLGLLQRAHDEASIDRAIALLEGLLRNSRDSAAVNTQLARALLYKSQLEWRPGLVEQATVYAERAVELDSSEPEMHVRLGQVRLAAGRYQDAAAEFRAALALQPDNPNAMLGLATTADSLGHGAEADQLYRKAIALRPADSRSYNLYGGFLFRTGRYREAVENYARFTQTDPTARGFANLGAAYQGLGDYDKARDAYQKSIALGPNHNAYLNLGLLLYYTGRYSEAAAALQQATAHAPSSYVAWLGLGDVYRRFPEKHAEAVKAYSNALKAAQEALAVNERDVPAHATAANALAKLGRDSQASEEIDRALKLDPTDQTVLYAAAVVAMLRGNSDVALGWLQRAVSSGYPVKDLQYDPEFTTLHADVAFPKLIVLKK